MLINNDKEFKINKMRFIITNNLYEYVYYIDVDVRKDTRTSLFTFKEEDTYVFSFTGSMKMYAFKPDRKVNIGSAHGQIIDNIDPSRILDSADRYYVNRLVYLWKKYHLNDLYPGNFNQTKFLLRHYGTEFRSVPYNDAVMLLRKSALKYNQGYVYADRWLCRPINEKKFAIIKNELIRIYKHLNNKTIKSN